MLIIAADRKRRLGHVTGRAPLLNFPIVGFGMRKKVWKTGNKFSLLIHQLPVLFFEKTWTGRDPEDPQRIPKESDALCVSFRAGADDNKTTPSTLQPFCTLWTSAPPPLIKTPPPLCHPSQTDFIRLDSSGFSSTSKWSSKNPERILKESAINLEESQRIFQKSRNISKNPSGLFQNPTEVQNLRGSWQISSRSLEITKESLKNPSKICSWDPPETFQNHKNPHGILQRPSKTLRIFQNPSESFKDPPKNNRKPQKSFRIPKNSQWIPKHPQKSLSDPTETFQKA